jgi:hypothetical protein
MPHHFHDTPFNVNALLRLLAEAVNDGTCTLQEKSVLCTWSSFDGIGTEHGRSMHVVEFNVQLYIHDMEGKPILIPFKFHANFDLPEVSAVEIVGAIMNDIRIAKRTIAATLEAIKGITLSPTWKNN